MKMTKLFTFTVPLLIAFLLLALLTETPPLTSDADRPTVAHSLLDVSAPPSPYGPGCPTATAEPGVVGGAQLHVSVKWCGISEAPSVDDPVGTLGCPDVNNFKTMLWRRHERASDKIWIPQCHITLRSGGTISMSDYLEFGDLQAAPGSPGDIDVVTDADADLLPDEMMDTWQACDMAWAAQPKGIIAVSANRLVDGTGASVARGIALVGSIAFPWMCAADPDVFQQANERSLAHEVGHVFGLGHTATAGNLMQGGGTGATLTAAQCNTSRTYVTNNPILDPPNTGEAEGFVDFLYDGTADEDIPPYLNVRKIVGMDNTKKEGALSFHLALAGLLPDFTGGFTFEIFLDTDNNGQTGIAGNEFLATIQMGESAQVGEVTLSGPDGLGEFFTPITAVSEQISALANLIRLAIDPIPGAGFEGPTEFPVFHELAFVIDNSALPILGLPTDGRVFPQGMSVLVRTIDANGTIIDRAEGTLAFPEIIFPVIEIQDTVTAGEIVPVEVSGMTPNSPLGMFFGDFAPAINVMSDAAGNASFNFQVPAEADEGPALVTVGIDDPAQPNNAVTADDIVFVRAPNGMMAGVNCPETVPQDCDFKVVITADVSDVPAPDNRLGSFTGIVSWDPTLLSFTGQATILSGYNGFINADAAAGTLTFNGANTNGVAGIVDLLKLHFTAVGPVGSTATVDVNFTAAAAAGTFNSLLPELVLEACTIEITLPGLLGDVNGDGLVNSTDGNILLSFDVGLVLPPAIQALIDAGLGDVNQDGQTNVVDALIVLTFDVGLPVPYPIGEPFCPSDAHWQTTGGLLPDTPQVPVYLQQPNRRSVGEVFDVSVIVDMSSTQERLGAYSADLQWDPQVFELLNCKGGQSGFGKPVLNEALQTQGKLKVAGASPYGVAGRVQVLNLQFRQLKPSRRTPLSARFTEMVSARTFTPLLPQLQASPNGWSPFVSPSVALYPNPFWDLVTLGYELPTSDQVRIDIWNLSGQHIRNLVNEYQTAGSYQAVWHGDTGLGAPVPAGVYLMKVQIGSMVQTHRIVRNR